MKGRAIGRDDRSGARCENVRAEKGIERGRGVDAACLGVYLRVGRRARARKRHADRDLEVDVTQLDGVIVSVVKGTGPGDCHEKKSCR